MSKEEIIDIIKTYLAKKPIEWAGIFGSFARNEMTQDSDIDIVVHFIPGAKVSLVDYVRYKQELEELTNRKVDLVTYKYLRPKLKSYIDKDLHIIYAAA